MTINTAFLGWELTDDNSTPNTATSMENFVQVYGDVCNVQSFKLNSGY